MATDSEPKAQLSAAGALTGNCSHLVYFRAHANDFYNMLNAMYEFMFPGAEKTGKIYNSFERHCSTLISRGDGAHIHMYRELYKKFEGQILTDSDSWLRKGDIELAIEAPETKDGIKPIIYLSKFYNRTAEIKNPKTPIVLKDCRIHLYRILFCVLEDSATTQKETLAKLSGISMSPKEAGDGFEGIVTKLLTVGTSMDFKRLQSKAKKGDITGMYEDAIKQVNEAGIKFNNFDEKKQNLVKKVVQTIGVKIRETAEQDDEEEEEENKPAPAAATVTPQPPAAATVTPPSAATVTQPPAAATVTQPPAATVSTPIGVTSTPTGGSASADPFELIKF